MSLHWRYLAVAIALSAWGGPPGPQPTPASASSRLEEIALVGKKAGPGGPARTGGAAPQSNLRLPGNVAPLRYAAELRLSPGADTFSGHISIELQVRALTDTIWLNAEDLSVQQASVGKGPAQVSAGAGGLLEIRPVVPLQPGAARLEIDYTGKINLTANEGLFRVKDGNDAYLFTQFEPMAARRVFPCFDEPVYKTPWRLSVITGRSDQVFSNTAITARRPDGPDLDRIQFAETKPIPSYLVALAVGPFEVRDAGRWGLRHTPVRIITPRKRTEDAALASVIAPQTLVRLEEYLGIPYPFDKLDEIAIPAAIGFNAMENAGLVTFAERTLLVRPGEETPVFRSRLERTTQHELAHHWFGNLVTPAWWDDIWLSEAFAVWMESKLGSSGASARREALADASSPPIRIPVFTRDDVGAAFNGAAFRKGAAVLQMFEDWLGPQRMQAVLRRYLNANAWGAAVATDFLAQLKAEAGPDTSRAFSGFLERPGLPLLTVGLRCSAASAPEITVEQQPSPEPWLAPFCVDYGAAGKTGHHCELLSTKNAALQVPLSETQSLTSYRAATVRERSLRRAASGLNLCPEWVLGNPTGSGFYLTAYRDQQLEQLISGGLDRFSDGGRSAMVTDLQVLARYGSLPADRSLAMAATLARNSDPALVSAGASLVTAVRNLVPDPLRPRYSRFVASLFQQCAEALGWEPKPGEEESSKLLRSRLTVLAAGEGQSEKLRTQARDLTMRWLADNTPVDAAVLNRALWIAAQYGDWDLYRALLAAARNAPGPKQREPLLAALSWFRNPEIAQAAMALVLSPDFDIRESINILKGPASGFETRALSYEFVKEHYGQLVERLPAGAAPDFVPYFPLAAQSLCDPEAERDVDSFFRERARAVPGGTRVLDQVLDQIRACARKRAEQAPRLERFFSDMVMETEKEQVPQ
jgi:alanyl aminopeptidase